MRLAIAGMMAALLVACLPASALPLADDLVEPVQVEANVAQPDSLLDAAIGLDAGAVSVDAAATGPAVSVSAGSTLDCIIERCTSPQSETASPAEPQALAPTSAPPANPQAAGATTGSQADAGAWVGLVALVTALLAKAGGVGAAGWLARIPGIGLFSRVAPGEVLEHPTRAAMHDFVAHNPGATIQDIRRGAGAAWGTTLHHLRRLQGAGLLVVQRQGGQRLHFVANTPESKARAALSVLHHPVRRRIAFQVQATPDAPQGTICEATGVRAPSASKHLRALADAGLVTSQRRLRNVIYEPTPLLGQALALMPA